MKKSSKKSYKDKTVGIVYLGQKGKDNMAREDGDNFEPGSHRDFGTYDVEVMNGDGYYDEEGWFHRYLDVD